MFPSATNNILGREFFARPTLTVARALLGQRLVRQLNGELLAGRIVETEAYIGPDDTACHAHKGRTARTEVMFGSPGVAYVYLIYGIHSMLNIVTEQVGFPAAVLIRAVDPLEGQETMRQRRPPASTLRQLTNGPGKLCQAFGIDRRLNGWEVTKGQQLWLEAGQSLSEVEVATGPRVGITYADPADRQVTWRFWIQDNEFVSPTR